MCSFMLTFENHPVSRPKNKKPTYCFMFIVLRQLLLLFPSVFSSLCNYYIKQSSYQREYSLFTQLYKMVALHPFVC